MAGLVEYIRWPDGRHDIGTSEADEDNWKKLREKERAEQNRVNESMRTLKALGHERCAFVNIDVLTTRVVWCRQEPCARANKAE
jgi:hypothetical protein